MNLDKLAKNLHETAREKGFWDPSHKMEGELFVFYAKQIAMIHSEATEVLEALRKSKGQELVVEELADIIIRVLDLYAGMLRNGDVQDSLHDTLQVKAKFNTTRPKMHGVAG
jgi:NTP pyrophosphatase (non-canonical NTP hydrolase)